MNNPTNLKYTKSDEWIKVDGNIATIGISDYAQSQLSDIVYLEYLVDVDDEVSKGDACVTLESVKAAADVNCPLSGKVTEINESLSDEFEAVNSDPFGKAWMVKIEFTDASELDEYMTAEEYSKYNEEREH
ncbi:MAG: glycine cleavage system protein H [Anaerolineaceae bacterium]|nr:glycine cleavage system protein H [Anaerolineaceae bacterium]